MTFPVAVPAIVRSAATEPARRLRLMRRRVQPAALQIARLVLAAMTAYGLALVLLPAKSPMLAALTALLVMQLSSYATLRSSVLRVISVASGVILAVLLAALIGFSWWSLAAVIGAALALGHVMKLGDHLLEVPISAMLVLQVHSDAAAADRILETLIGSAVGLGLALALSPVRTRPAGEAIAGLGRSMARLLDDIASGLGSAPDSRMVQEWSARAKALGREIRRVEAELTAAEDSTRLNPRAGAAEAGVTPALRSTLETLELAAITLRVLTRSVADRTELSEGDRTDMWERDVRDGLAAVLRQVAEANRAYAGSVTAQGPEEAARLQHRMELSLKEAGRRRAALGDLLAADHGHWQLHGELLVHLDRLIDGLRDARRPLAVRRARPAAVPQQHAARRRPGARRSRPAYREHAAPEARGLTWTAMS